MALVVTGVSTLIHLYAVAYMGSDRGYARFFAYLNFFVFSMLVLVMAANFLLLIIGWAFVGAASYLLISFWYRRTTATAAGIKAFVINVVGDVGLVLGTFFIFRHSAHAGLPGAPSTRRPGTSPAHSGALTAGLILPARRRLREVGPGPAAHLAPGRDGGPDAGLRAHPRRHHGHGRRLPHRAHAHAVRAVGHRVAGGRHRRLRDAAGGRDDRPRRDRPQARHRLLDDVADRLHGHGRERRRVRGRALPPHDARLLQGAALHGRRLGHQRDGGRAVAGPHERLQARDAVHLRVLRDRRPGARRRPAVLGLLLQGRDPGRRSAPAAAAGGSSTSPATSARSSPRSTRGG